MSFLTRFAPSPTGLIHLGTAASALHVWHAAARAGGSVLLRIEDIDQTRCRPDFSRAIQHDLAWLGLDWPRPVRIQSEHSADYQRTLQSLEDRGLVYRCFRTRTEIAAISDGRPFTGGPLDPHEEQAQLARGTPYAWRLSLRAAQHVLKARYNELDFIDETSGAPVRVRADPARHGDVVLARKDAPAAYHLAATHDDALQGITHVIRGMDLVEAAHIHVLIQALMNWPTPVYRHHGLILDMDGRKLSKRDRSKTLASMRNEGLTPEDIRMLAGF